MLTIDGSMGEGGGQIIRTAVALSLITGTPFKIHNVRAKRSKPGLQRQHLTGVLAAAEIGQAQAKGATLGARAFAFLPGKVSPGDYAFRIGTAGATTLVLQTVLPPLMLAGGPSRITLEGGTHNPHAPPYDFLAKTFVPLLNRLGPSVRLRLDRYGFYPPGGGKIHVEIDPAGQFQRLELVTRGPIACRRARALVVKLPESIAERELAVVAQRLGWPTEELEVVASQNGMSPGNVLTLELQSEHVTELFTRVGERGLRAERVAEEVVQEVERYLEIDAPVGEHLADQLLLPLALGAGGSYTTGPLSLHTVTNIEVVRMFLDVEIKTTELSEGVVKIEVNK